MFYKFYIAVVASVGLFFQSVSQNVKYDMSDEAIEMRLKKDVSILASDSFLGREAGTEGEILARNFLIERFKEIGLLPLFPNNSYIQEFDANGGALIKINELVINDIAFPSDDNFYPVDFSGNDTVDAEVVKVKYGVSAPELNYDNYKNFKDIRNKVYVMEYELSDSLKKIAGFEKYIDPKQRAISAIEKGAKGIIFFNSNEMCVSKPSKILSNNTSTLSVPVVFAEKKVSKMIKAAANMKVHLEVEVKRKKTNTSFNVGGYIDNKAKYSVVIGAHYDHLGYSKDSDGKKYIFNGADDNASGTAAMLELARYFSDTAKERYNVIFLAFSAEEKGLYGSIYFIASNAIDISKIAFMFNCDMLGRLDSLKKLTIYCTGSSPAWNEIIDSTDAMNLIIDKEDVAESGSDHYIFYRNNIPSVFFYTRTHKDYHKQTDDVWKINFKGETHIVKYIERFFNNVKGNKKLPFSRTSDKYMWY